MAPARAWGLLDLLDGGSAPWLSAVARSQIRAGLRSLGRPSAEEWRALLRARCDVQLVRLHPAGLDRLLAVGGVLPAGPEQAVKAGANLDVVAPIVEVYLRPGDWPALAKRWYGEAVSADGNLRVHLPRDVWPFDGGAEVSAAALAADLLDSPEPRASRAGLKMLNELVRDSA
jgi:hypothetical protein